MKVPKIILTVNSNLWIILLIVNLGCKSFASVKIDAKKSDSKEQIHVEACAIPPIIQHAVAFEIHHKDGCAILRGIGIHNQCPKDHHDMFKTKVPSDRQHDHSYILFFNKDNAVLESELKKENNDDALQTYARRRLDPKCRPIAKYYYIQEHKILGPVVCLYDAKNFLLTRVKSDGVCAKAIERFIDLSNVECFNKDNS